MDSTKFEQLLEKARKLVPTFKKFPTQDELRAKLHCGREYNTAVYRALAKEYVPVPVDELRDTLDKANQGIEDLINDPGKLTEVSDVSKDHWLLSLPKTRIHTLKQLFEHFQVDLTIWECDRFICNKWDMGYVTKDGVADQHELYQVKAYLRKKIANDIDGYVAENSKLMQQNEKLRKEIVRDRKYAKKLAENHVGADELLKNIQTFVKEMGDFPAPVTRISAQKPQTRPPVKEGHSEDAVLVISDTHFGDRIRKGDTSGFPEFDLTIAGNRFGYIIGKAKKILGLHRAMYPIKRLYVPILGDIGNGDLHDAPKSNVLFIAPQIHFSYHMLRFAIEDLLTLRDEGIVEEIVLLFSVGNHMRMAEDLKMPTKLQAMRTFDWLIYQFVIERFKNEPGVTIHETMSPFIFENIRGHRYGFNHGMEVGYKNSPEAQAKSISSFINHTRALFDSPVYRAHAGLEGATFDRFVIGDIHVPVSFPRLLSNGSLNGQNELGVNWGLEVIPAGQWLFGVSDKQIQTWQYFIDCTHVQREEADSNGYGKFAEEYEKKFGRL
jgi:hypothetical protein